MKRKYSPYAMSPWMKKIRGVCQQFALPFIVFQGIRTLIFPTFLDMLLLILFITLALSLYLEWI
jgi:hypothetical protein